MTSRRQRERAARRAALHRTILAEAKTPAARAAAEYDFARTAIYDLPAGQQPAAWTELKQVLADFRVNLPDPESPQVNKQVHKFTSQRGRGVPRIPRPASRARARETQA